MRTIVEQLYQVLFFLQPESHTIVKAELGKHHAVYHLTSLQGNHQRKL